MILKKRTEPYDLKIYRFLNTRMELTENEKRRLSNLEKGYLGELKFDELAERQLDDHIPILNDLLMEYNNSHFQIDSFIIASGVGNLIDVKYSEGDYIYKEGQFYPMGSNQEILNPLGQLDRCVTLLRKSISNKDCQIPIKPYLVFVNPNFTLYQAPPHLPIIFPTQLDAFWKKLNTGTTKLNNRQTKLIETLLAAHITKNPFSKLPPYSFEQLKKGNNCCRCQSFSIVYSGRKMCCCLDCGFEELVESAVLRAVEEFRILFPCEKVTTKIIHKWCGEIKSIKSIKRILKKNYQEIGYGKWVHFV